MDYFWSCGFKRCNFGGLRWGEQTSHN
ncbi:hypothetical protein NC652_019738 [Populus alba x Populus x berolinensis]|nr:hypothetical protein NC652_019738 [Populus alba x Populus x berolinensis]